MEELRVAEEELRVVSEQVASADQALYAERERYRALFQANPAAHLVTDLVGVVSEANQQAVELLGVDHRHLVGKPLVTFITAQQRRAVRNGLRSLLSSDELQEWTLPLQPRNRTPVVVLATVGVARDHPSQPAAVHWLLRQQPDTAEPSSADPRVLVELLTGQSLPAAAGSAGGISNITSALRQGIETVVGLLGADGGVLALIDEDGVLGWVTATSQPAHLLAQVETNFGEGPGMDARAAGRPVATPDVRGEQRWVRLGPVAASHGVRAVLATSVQVDGRSLGALSVVAGTSRGWSEGEAQAISGHAAMLGRLLVTAADAVAQRRLAGQLQTALDSRLVIEQAKGILMERKGLVPSQAFQLLRRMARNSSRSLVDIATDVIAGHRL
jgi:PAS domain S-box-containing protein